MIKRICAMIFKLTGWTFKNDIPSDLGSFVFIGAPHTSNYDFIPAMSIVHFLKWDAHFVIKKEWMKFPLTLFLRPLGAIGVDRNATKNAKPLNYTDSMAALFKKSPNFILMISPEGTRGPNKNWKTGFYYIAQKANVPMVLGYADYRNKVAGVGKVIYPKDFKSDMEEIMSFYQDKFGKVEENFLLDERFMSKLQTS